MPNCDRGIAPGPIRATAITAPTCHVMRIAGTEIAQVSRRNMPLKPGFLPPLDLYQGPFRRSGQTV